jgi:hypothetical protein
MFIQIKPAARRNLETNTLVEGRPGALEIQDKVRTVPVRGTGLALVIIE